ncbi:MAG: hypothetical protein R3E64_05280 [Halioglobus sp.]
MHLRCFLKTVALDIGDGLMTSTPAASNPLGVDDCSSPVVAGDWVALRQLDILR